MTKALPAVDQDTGSSVASVQHCARTSPHSSLSGPRLESPSLQLLGHGEGLEGKAWEA